MAAPVQSRTKSATVKQYHECCFRLKGLQAAWLPPSLFHRWLHQVSLGVTDAILWYAYLATPSAIIPKNRGSRKVLLLLLFCRSCSSAIGISQMGWKSKNKHLSRPLLVFSTMCRGPSSSLRYSLWQCFFVSRILWILCSTEYDQSNRSPGFLNFQLINTTTWLWRWLPHRLSKRQSLTRVLLRTPITQMIFFNQGMLLLGSNHFLIYRIWPLYWLIIIITKALTIFTCSQQNWISFHPCSSTSFDFLGMNYTGQQTKKRMLITLHLLSVPGVLN